MAHRYAATKIIYSDSEILRGRGKEHDPRGYEVHVWLENNNIIQLNDKVLKIIYTPGHTSGSICIYETRQKLLFTGDTIFSKGTISAISNSGSYGEYINSLRILKTYKIDTILPGHGSLSNNVDMDLDTGIKNAQKRHDDYLEYYN